MQYLKVVLNNIDNIIDSFINSIASKTTTTNNKYKR